MKIKAHKRAELINPQKSKDVHHIVSKFTANKYGLPTHLVKRDENAIALERDFHAWIHGCRLTPQQIIVLLGNEISELEKQIDDREIGWEGFTEDDYIFLAVAYLGIDEKYFQEPHKLKRKKPAR
jgi:hypothetical protein